MDEQKLKELVECDRDPIYFIKNFVKVDHPTQGRIPFVLFPFQENLIRSYHDHQLNIALISRQMGSTTTAAAYLLWSTLFRADQTILITSTKLRQAQEILHRIKAAYIELPDHLRAGLVRENLSEVAFDNGSRIFAAAATRNTGRGLSLNMLYVDSMAWMPQRELNDFWAGILPTMMWSHRDNKIIVSSSAATKNSIFLEMWENAHAGLNDFHPTEIKWSDHPLRDDIWANNQISHIGQSHFEQEFENKFV